MSKRPTLEIACICLRKAGCFKCEGTGKVFKLACRRCLGSGKDGGRCPDCRGLGYRDMDNHDIAPEW